VERTAQSGQQLQQTIRHFARNPRESWKIAGVHNAAIAFRYEWPEQAALKDFDIMDELTEFVFPADHTVLWEPV
jgi:alpha-glucosidase